MGSGRTREPLAAAKRELAEETGYRALHWRLLVPRFSLANSVGDQTGCIFVATGLEAGAAAPEPTEEIATRWISLDDGLEMIDEGTIDDSVTQVALLRLEVERHT